MTDRLSLEATRQAKVGFFGMARFDMFLQIFLVYKILAAGLTFRDLQDIVLWSNRVEPWAWVPSLGFAVQTCPWLWAALAY